MQKSCHHDHVHITNGSNMYKKREATYNLHGAGAELAEFFCKMLNIHDQSAHVSSAESCSSL